MAEKKKEEGNKLMKEDKFVEAMMVYTEAIKMDPKVAAIYANRSLAFLKMQQYYLAMEDAQMAIKLEPKWPKGYFRMGEVQSQVELYKDAIWSYKQAFVLAPEHENLRLAVSSAKSQLSAQIKSERRLPVYGVIAGMLVGLLICAADQFTTKNPVLQHVTLQGLTVVAISAICYAGATFYTYFLRNQRKGLLEPPVDIFKDDARQNNSSSSSPPDGDTDNHTSSKPRKRVSAAAAKHKARQASK